MWLLAVMWLPVVMPTIVTCHDTGFVHMVRVYQKSLGWGWEVLGDIAHVQSIMSTMLVRESVHFVTRTTNDTTKLCRSKLVWITPPSWTSFHQKLSSVSLHQSFPASKCSQLFLQRICFAPPAALVVRCYTRSSGILFPNPPFLRPPRLISTIAITKLIIVNPARWSCS